MQHIIDTLRMKLDLNTSENEELKRQLTSYKKKDTEIDKLKIQLEKLRNQNTKSM